MRAKWRWFVYILLCKNKRYYTGMSWNIPNRFDQHISKLGGKYTAKYGVEKLVYAEVLEDFQVAKIREQTIKDMSQKKKLKLIESFEGLD
jgi:putative endonuclease